MKAPRIAGVDLAYAISVCVVICFSLSAGFSGREASLSGVSFDLLTDTFAALFIFLNGITATLMMRRGNSSRRKMRRYLVRQGILFLILGFISSFFWPIQMLSLLGVLFLTAPILTQLTGSILRVLYVVDVVSAILFFSFGDAGGVSTAPAFAVNEEFVLGYSSYFLVSGYFSLLPWAVFFISGVLFGRLDFLNPKIKRTSGFLSWVAIIVGSILQIFGGSLFTTVAETKSLLIFPFIFTPEFNIISFILIATGLSIILLNACIQWSEKKKGANARLLLQRMGSIKHSLYVNHLIYGIVLILVFGSRGIHDLGVMLALVGFFMGASVAFTWLWKKQFNLGPVEWVLKLLSGSNEKT